MPGISSGISQRVSLSVFLVFVSVLVPFSADAAGQTGMWKFSELKVFHIPYVRVLTAKLFVAREDGYTYSHHPALGECNGELYASWSNGIRGEDEPGQVVQWSRLNGNGKWTEPRLLAKPGMLYETHPEVTSLINGGLVCSNGNLLQFYSGFSDKRTSYNQASKWAPPLLAGVFVLDSQLDVWHHRGAIIDDFLVNEAPRKTSNGRWIMTGENCFGQTKVAYSDSLDLSAAKSWRTVSVPKGEGAFYKNEASWIEYPNGNLGLFLRDDGKSRSVWRSESKDRGESWTVPLKSNFPDAMAKGTAGRLGSGDYYYISNPNRAGRIPLTIAISKDGRLFDRIAILRACQTNQRFPGKGKCIGYQYPNAIEYGDRLYVIYSVNKEDIEVLSVSLMDLELMPRFL